MGRTVGTEQSTATLTLQIKVKLDGMDNVAVDDCASGAITATITFIFRAREEANVVTFANNDNRDGGVETQFIACASDKGELVLDNRGRLSFRDTASKTISAWGTFPLTSCTGLTRTVVHLVKRSHMGKERNVP